MLLLFFRFFIFFFVSFFFFLMIRRPPRSTLFPYTTSSDLPSRMARRAWIQAVAATMTRARRSEEHTSELQSRGHLVCRLLLEKKKKTNKGYSSFNNDIKSHRNSLCTVHS